MNKIIPIFRASVLNGKLKYTLTEKEKLNKYISTLNGDMEVVVRPHKITNPASIQQRRYLFGVIYKILSEELGYSVDEIHEICKMKFLSKTTFVPTTENYESIKIPKSTTELNTIEFEEYFSNIRQWAVMDLGIFIPEPNEVDYES